MAKLDREAQVMLANIVAGAGNDIGLVRDLVKAQVRGTKDLARLRYLMGVLRVEAMSVIRRQERSRKRRLGKAVPIEKVLTEKPFVFTRAMARDAHTHARAIESTLPPRDRE